MISSVPEHCFSQEIDDQLSVICRCFNSVSAGDLMAHFDGHTDTAASGDIRSWLPKQPGRCRNRFAPAYLCVYELHQWPEGESKGVARRLSSVRRRAGGLMNAVILQEYRETANERGPALQTFSRIVSKGRTSVLDVGARDSHFSLLLAKYFETVTALELE